MNERIEELAEQSDMTQYVSAKNKYLERFAVLIIQECITLGDKAVQDGNWPGDVIQKHFGINQ